MEANQLMGSRFSSDDELRGYVESELERTVRTEHPDLRVDFGPREFTVVPRFTPLCWLIESARTDHTMTLRDRHYLLEARRSEGQFVIWFGGMHGFTTGDGTTRDVILPAVHVPFSLLHHGARPTHSGYGVGAVLSWMLAHAQSPAGEWDPMVYPMNGHR